MQSYWLAAISYKQILGIIEDYAPIRKPGLTFLHIHYYNGLHVRSHRENFVMLRNNKMVSFYKLVWKSWVCFNRFASLLWWSELVTSLNFFGLFLATNLRLVHINFSFVFIFIEFIMVTLVNKIIFLIFLIKKIMYVIVESSMELPQKIKNGTALWPSDSTSGNISQKSQNTNLRAQRPPYVHSNVTYSNQDLEAAQVFISRWVDKKVVVHVHSGILLGHKKEKKRKKEASTLSWWCLTKNVFVSMAPCQKVQHFF